MWKTLRGLGFVYANGNGRGGQSSGRRQAAAPTVVGVGAPDNTGALRRREDVRRHGGMPPYGLPYRDL